MTLRISHRGETRFKNTSARFMGPTILTPLWAEVQGKILTRVGEQECSSAMKSLKDIRSSLRSAGV